MSLILVKQQKPKPRKRGKRKPGRRRKPGPKKRRQKGKGILTDLGKILAKEVVKEVAPKAVKAVSKKIFGKGVVLAGGRGRGLKLAGQGPTIRQIKRKKIVRRKVPQFIVI